MRTSRPLHHLASAIAAVGLVATGWLATAVVIDRLVPEPEPTTAEPGTPLARPDRGDRPGVALDGTWPRVLAAQGFVVEHIQVGDDGTELGYFSARVEVAPSVAVVRDTGLPGGGRGDLLLVNLNGGEVSTSDVVKKDPMGLAKVGWETDLMPLPGYPYQAISGGVAHFDSGAVTAERGTSYQLAFPIPAGAGELQGIDLTFDWLDQGRTLRFAA